VNRVPDGCRAVLAGLSLAGAISPGGCITDKPGPDTQEGVPPITTATIQENASVQYYPSDEPLRLGLEHFNRGNFGVAEQYFRDAVEKAPRDASAWIGLGASYDRLGRFDLAAYNSAIHLVGETTAYSQQSRLLFYATRKPGCGASRFSQGLGTRTWQSDYSQQP